ncbi:hypothetical protein DVS28_b0330 (plasmid) [Euzebya pacifica]|uniref:Uncharacterized protein n=2 Tax=Euzebya pacifica TaxID=1608957 RepID=A0A346Y6K3_9ACTN|nr:hypothetical protein DVS28_b0330 [Euzebya pacifica]
MLAAALKLTDALQVASDRSRSGVQIDWEPVRLAGLDLAGCHLRLAAAIWSAVTRRDTSGAFSAERTAEVTVDTPWGPAIDVDAIRQLRRLLLSPDAVDTQQVVDLVLSVDHDDVNDSSFAGVFRLLLTRVADHHSDEEAVDMVASVVRDELDRSDEPDRTMDMLDRFMRIADNDGLPEPVADGIRLALQLPR